MDIARALIHNPKLLILDEPTTGLDPKTRALVWDLVNNLRKENNLTVLLTTHYMEEASEADNVVIIDNGKIVAFDTPINLKNKYAKDQIFIYEYSNSLVDELNNNNLEFSIINGVIVITLKGTKQAKDIIVKHQKHIIDFEVIKGDMDSVFLNVTGKELKGF